MRSSLVVSSSILRASLRVLLASMCDVCVRERKRERKREREEEREKGQREHGETERVSTGGVYIR